jgi:hypothetical protein
MAEQQVNTTTRWSPLQIPQIVKAHYKAKVPVNFVAEPSTVKSEGVLVAAKEIAQAEGKEFIEWNRLSLGDKQKLAEDASTAFIFADLRASETDIGELRLQDLKENKSYITFKYNILFEALSKPEAKGILFFDEMNLAPNMIKAQFYKIINDKAIGDIPINPDVLCVSAGNESEHSRNVTEDPVPLVLRRGNYFLRPVNEEEFLDYAVKNDVHEWIVGYLGFAPSKIHRIEYDLPDGVGQPCPRMWTKLSQILTTNKVTKPEDVLLFATGTVGQATAIEFTSYVKSAKNINIQQIIENPELIAQYDDDKNISLMYAIVAGVVEKFKKNKKIIGSAFKIAAHVKRPEFGAFLLRSLKSADSVYFMNSADEFSDNLIERYAKYLVE